MAIAWRKFNIKNLQEIIDKVGMENNRVSKMILVMVKFEDETNKEFLPRFANVLKYNKLPLEISVQTMTGRVVISHWTEINLPK